MKISYALNNKPNSAITDKEKAELEAVSEKRSLDERTILQDLPKETQYQLFRLTLSNPEKAREYMRKIKNGEQLDEKSLMSDAKEPVWDKKMVEKMDKGYLSESKMSINDLFTAIGSAVSHQDFTDALKEIYGKAPSGDEEMTYDDRTKIFKVLRKNGSFFRSDDEKKYDRFSVIPENLSEAQLMAKEIMECAIKESGRLTDSLCFNESKSSEIEIEGAMTLKTLIQKLQKKYDLWGNDFADKFGKIYDKHKESIERSLSPNPKLGGLLVDIIHNDFKETLGLNEAAKNEMDDLNNTIANSVLIKDSSGLLKVTIENVKIKLIDNGKRLCFAQEGMLTNSYILDLKINEWLRVDEKHQLRNTIHLKHNSGASVTIKINKF